jgi:hypothetical protein
MLRRRIARKIARESWIEANGDADLAIELCRHKMQEGRYGFVGTLAAIAAILQIIYLLYKIWKEWNMLVPPDEPMEGEPEFNVDLD